MMRILVTAGPTREYIDSVRFLSNASSGITGYQIAAAGMKLGHRMTLISGPVSLKPPAGVELIDVASADQMYRACMRHFPRVDAVIMTAAVCDYRPAKQAPYKLKKTSGPMTLRLLPTPDILSELGRRKRSRQILIGFALEDRKPRISARAKVDRKNLDAIVLNSPAAIGNVRNKVDVYHSGRWHAWPDMSKQALGRRLICLTEQLFTTDQNKKQPADTDNG
jgi:phosphopantothenoylcysteine decarboxylase/phosphopantothenate--cysteine ligase